MQSSVVTRSVAAASVVLLTAAGAYGQTPTALSLETTTVLQLKGGEARRFTLPATAGRLAQFSVIQDGIDVRVEILSAGKPFDSIDEVRSTTGSETVEVIVPADASISVSAKGDAAANGQVTISPVAVSEPTEERRALVEASRGLREADRLSGSGQAEGIRASIPLYENAASVFEKSGEKKLAGKALDGLAWVLDESGHMRNALATYERALTFRRAAGDADGEAMTLQGMGIVYIHLGNYDKALETSQQVIELARRNNDRKREAGTLHNMGGIHWSIDEMQTALDYYGRALAIWNELGEKGSKASTLNNTGDVYRRLGDYDRALSHFRQALEIRRSLGNKRGEAHSLHTIGLVHIAKEEYEPARASFEKALALRKETGDRRGEAYSTGGLAQAMKGLGQLDRAVELQTAALEMWKQMGERRAEAETMENLGQTLAARGDYDKALSLFNLALPVSRAVKDLSSEANTLLAIARVERDRGDLAAAQKRAEEAIAVIETLRSRVASHELRASYFASVKKFYDFYVDLLMRRHEADGKAGFAARAFEASERARARMLLETLAGANLDIRTGVDASLLAREESLLQAIGRKQKQQARLLESSAAADEQRKVDDELAALLNEYETVLTDIRRTSPAYAELVTPSPLAVKEVQALLGDETSLVEYHLGEDRSFVFVVTSAGVQATTLPSKSTIEKSAMTVHSGLKNRDSSADPAQWQAAAGELAGMVVPQLTTRRVVIAADGALHYVPFAALPSGDGKPMIVSHEVVVVPSASVLAAIRRQTAGRAPAAKEIAVFADPVFQRNDPRVRARSTGEVKLAANSDALTRSADDSGLSALNRLRFSRKEAEAITELIPEGRYAALDFEADREAVTGSSLRDYRRIHFATHGLLNSRHPELSGLVLSLVDEKGSVRDGFLRLQEIYNLDLGADLVVLSACQTALGAEIRGEGLVGLTRGFMFAGAPRVVASLWQVDDRATAELMKRFYNEMIVSKKTPSEALRAAQLSLLEQKRWQSPYYWAAFQLQGEWE
jgi:CHAT domain-containing protein/tetratricopeptide (TPR) repeat protein